MKSELEDIVNVSEVTKSAEKTKTFAEQATAHGIKLLDESESFSDIVKNTNPKGIKDNCTSCSVTSELRKRGLDVTAKDVGGQNLINVAETCFKLNSSPLEGSAVVFGKSQTDAANVLKRRFGDNASGVVGVKWKGTDSGHAFSWKIENGVVTFFDSQDSKRNYKTIISSYWDKIDINGLVQIVRLDDADVDFDNLTKFVDVRK